MAAGRGLIKYGLFLFVAAWMFALGVIVGRGTSPVTFDTQSFQERLQVIVRSIDLPKSSEEQVELEIDELSRPVRHEVAGNPKKQGEILARPETAAVVPLRQLGEEIPVKRSRKKATFKQKATFNKKTSSNKVPADEKKAVIPVADKSSPAEPVTKKAGVKKRTVVSTPKAPSPVKTADAGKVKSKASSDRSDSGAYTIQVASFRAFKDAVSQMSRMAEKGFPAYRTKGEKDGKTWYRVRTGPYKDLKTAQAALEKLKQAKIDGFIMKKEN